MAFQRATKAKSKLRCALFGPSGSGKTFSALRIAQGLGGTIALIDTESGSASKYANRFAFDVCDLADCSIAGYVATIKQAEEAGYGVLIIDSMTHAWQDLLQEVDKLAKTKYSGNTWAAWSDGTPKQRRFINALLAFPGHVIATMRTKTEWVIERNEKTGRNEPKRVGLAPEQGKGIEYELDLLVELTPEHIGRVLKDRTGKFQDSIIEQPGEEFGRQLAEWLSEGVEPPPPPAQQAPAATNGHSEWQIACGALLTTLKAGGDPRFANKTKMAAHIIDWAHARGFDVANGQPVTIEGLGSLTEEQREKYASTLTDLVEEQKAAKATAK